jgi:hypothetical protein
MVKKQYTLHSSGFGQIPVMGSFERGVSLLVPFKTGLATSTHRRAT